MSAGYSVSAITDFVGDDVDMLWVKSRLIDGQPTGMPAELLSRIKVALQDYLPRPIGGRSSATFTSGPSSIRGSGFQPAGQGVRPSGGLSHSLSRTYRPSLSHWRAAV